MGAGDEHDHGVHDVHEHEHERGMDPWGQEPAATEIPDQPCPPAAVGRPPHSHSLVGCTHYGDERSSLLQLRMALAAVSGSAYSQKP